MSYIRCGSNLENLYIWGNGQTVFIAEGKKEPKRIPQKIMNGLIKKWKAGYGEDTKYRGAKITSVWVRVKNKNEQRTQLSYENWSIKMYYVTWAYIASSSD